MGIKQNRKRRTIAVRSLQSVFLLLGFRTKITDAFLM